MKRQRRQRRFDVNPDCGCLWDRHPGLTHEEWTWLLDLDLVVKQFREWNAADRPVDVLADELERLAAAGQLRWLQTRFPLQETFSERFLAEHNRLCAELRAEVERFSVRHRQRFAEAMELERRRVMERQGRSRAKEIGHGVDRESPDAA